MANELEQFVRSIAIQLADGQYEAVVNGCRTSRVAPLDFERVINEYGHKLVAPPPDAYARLDKIAVRGTAYPTWSIRAPLWTSDEGRSDLTLELKIT